MVLPCSDRVSRAPPYSKINNFSTPTGLSPILVNLSRSFGFFIIHRSAGPRSLATTSGVSFDVLSYRYLDVSVPCVRLATLFIHVTILPFQQWVLPFGYLRIIDRSHLPVAFRSVLRPSSPPNVKASTKCPSCACLLKSQNLNDCFRTI